jgi:hypothetical protein
MTHSLDIRQFSRREFLKLSGATLISLIALSRPSLAYAASHENQDVETQSGRITKNGVKMFDQPTLDGELIRTLDKDVVLPISNTSIGTGEPKANPIWYELNGEGYVHSGTVQPVKTLLNSLATSIPDTGLLAEVSVPYTDALWNLHDQGGSTCRLYYSTTHWILGVVQDDRGQFWYEVLEDFYRKQYYINPQHLRVISADETAPLSPSVPADEKRITVSLADQLVTAYEGESQVQVFRCSAGISPYYESLTPTGSFRTDYKRPSRHMIDGNDHHANTFNLPGVPWISYLDENGISFHGTYWHNNFGVPMSHGCINLPSSAAKWIYRWTLPSVPFGAQKGYVRDGGTTVTIA